MKRPEDYIRTAIMAVRFAKTRAELLTWWEEEAENRHSYGVTGPHEARLREVCRHHLSVITSSGYDPNVDPRRPRVPT